jgi:hypothetical protein
MDHRVARCWRARLRAAAASWSGSRRRFHLQGSHQTRCHERLHLRQRRLDPRETRRRFPLAGGAGARSRPPLASIRDLAENAATQTAQPPSPRRPPAPRSSAPRARGLAAPFGGGTTSQPAQLELTRTTGTPAPYAALVRLHHFKPAKNIRSSFHARGPTATVVTLRPRLPGRPMDGRSGLSSCASMAAALLPRSHRERSTRGNLIDAALEDLITGLRARPEISRA